MHRGATGRFHNTSTAGETVRAFVPEPLPPNPPLAFDGPLQMALEQALLALGRLDSITTLLPDPDLFLYSYVRKEAVLSSQIEGTQSSLSDLLLFEMKEAPGAPLDDVREVSNYVAALEHGIKRLRGGFPLSNRLLREIHGILLSHGRGSDKAPGEFRRSQNWVGGTRPGKALFVPPPHQQVEECMAALERFLHDDKPALPVLVKAGMAHVQFETIHPFLDGNGRVGRLLITFLLCHAGVLQEPTLYLSLYFKERRDEYYRLLEEVRRTGDWEEWLAFFLEGVRLTADGAVTTARRLVEIFQKDRSRIEKKGRAAGSALRVHDVLKERPLVGLQEVSRRSRLSFPTSTSGMKLLIDLGIARELTGKRRNRIFGYDRYLKILSEGTEPL
ncbi:MAG: cell filamentation protein Fic [Acidobacteria bacterium]|nr:MAG: cell filamentation protein Fic [Acidobacteriota bacterium]